MATLDGGASTGCGGGGADEIGVYEQYTYEPYGQLAALDKFITTPPQNPVGHQGLFYDHYCATSPSAPCLQVAHKGLYQNRNRFYHPKLGRFTTPDPNSSAIPLVEGASYHGMPPTALAMVGSGALSQYSPMGQFGDGMNLYGYLGSSPVNLLDALGMEGDWDEELDEQISERTGNALYVLGTINESARVASIGLKTAVDIAKNFLPGSGLLEAFESVKIIASGKGGFWDAVNIATAAFPIAKGAAKLIGLRSLFKARVWKFKGCNCFIGGTLVDTPDGAVAIEDIRPGDLVFTWPEDQVYGERPAEPCASALLFDDDERTVSPGQAGAGSEIDEGGEAGAVSAAGGFDPCEESRPRPRVGRVTRVFRNVVPAILWLTLADGTVLGTTPGHQLWTHESGWTYAGELRTADDMLAACADEPGAAVGETLVGLDGQPIEVIAARLDLTPAVVYNLEIDGTWTYFVHGAWVHNDSCAILDTARRHGGDLHHALIQLRIQAIRGQGGVKGLRMNQALVLDGKKITSLRPDIQYVKEGKVYIEEIIDTHQVKGREGQFRALLGDKFGRYDEHFVE